MRDMFDRYITEVVMQHSSKNTRDYKTTSLARLRATMGDNHMSAITPQFIYQYRDLIGQTRSKKQANADLEVLSHSFTKAIEWGYLADHPMTNKKVVKYSLPGRDRYVEDWELSEWATVANPLLVVYAMLKGATGLRQQDILTLETKNISETELVSVNLKTGKRLRFPLRGTDSSSTTVSQALGAISAYYKGRTSKYVFFTREGKCYYNFELRRAPGFLSMWQRSMKKALEQTKLQESFTEHDLRAKVGSDLSSDLAAQTLLAHSSTALTQKHYRRKGTLVEPAQGFLDLS